MTFFNCKTYLALVLGVVAYSNAETSSCVGSSTTETAEQQQQQEELVLVQRQATRLREAPNDKAPEEEKEWELDEEMEEELEEKEMEEEEEEEDEEVDVKHNSAEPEPEPFGEYSPCTMLTNTHCQGHDLEQRGAPAMFVTAEECALHCAQTKKCGAFTFNIGSQGFLGDLVVNHSNPQAHAVGNQSLHQALVETRFAPCWLKTGCPNPTVDPKATSGTSCPQAESVLEEQEKVTAGKGRKGGKGCKKAKEAKKKKEKKRKEKAKKTGKGRNPCGRYGTGATGDPHMTNVHGEKFNLFKLGLMEFLRVPFESPPNEANLSLVANVQDVIGTNDECKQARYITSLLFGGAWIGDRKLNVSVSKGNMVVFLGSDRLQPSAQDVSVGSLKLDMPNEDQLKLRAGTILLEVTSAGNHGGAHYFLNLGTTSLASLSCKIGGLLGEDDHAGVSTPPPGCQPSSPPKVGRQEISMISEASTGFTSFVARSDCNE